MNVTFLTGEYPPMQGGIADYTAHLARYLLKLDINPSILVSHTYNEHRQPGVADDHGAQIPVYAHVGGWGMRCWWEIKQFLNRHPTAILHIQYQAAAFDLGGWVNWLPWAIGRWRSRPKIVTTFHDLRVPYLFPKAGRLRWQSMLALARHSDAVICTNQEDVAILGQYDWGNQVTEIPLGNNVPVNPPPGYNRRAWRERLGFGDEAVVLAYFGFLNKSKGGEELIATLDILVQQEVDVHLLMIGGDVGDSDPNNQAYARRVRQIIADYDLAQRIVFTGYVDLPQISAHLLAADMAVMPYRDGVSFRRTTLIAALQHGLPVISTVPTGELSQIADGENMVLVPPGDLPALAQAVIRIANDQTLQQYLSRGAEKLGERFDWSQIALDSLKLYQSLCRRVSIHGLH